MSEPSPNPEPLNPSLELTSHAEEMVLARFGERLARLEKAVADLGEPAALEERIVRKLRDNLPAANGKLQENIQEIPGPPPPPAAFDQTTTGRSGWLLLEALNELRLIVRMFFDRRYRVSMTTWIIVILFFPVILLSKWWFPLSWLPWVGDFADKFLDVVLAWVVYKALSRELRRYQAALKQY